MYLGLVFMYLFQIQTVLYVFCLDLSVFIQVCHILCISLFTFNAFKLMTDGLSWWHTRLSFKGTPEFEIISLPQIIYYFILLFQYLYLTRDKK